MDARRKNHPSPPRQCHCRHAARKSAPAFDRLLPVSSATRRAASGRTHRRLHIASGQPCHRRPVPARTGRTTAAASVMIDNDKQKMGGTMFKPETADGQSIAGRKHGYSLPREVSGDPGAGRFSASIVRRPPDRRGLRPDVRRARADLRRHAGDQFRPGRFHDARHVCGVLFLHRARRAGHCSATPLDRSSRSCWPARCWLSSATSSTLP